MAGVKLNKKDINKAQRFWWLTSNLTYNYQRLMAGAIAGAIGPILNKLYRGDKQKVAEGLRRHMLYFNTQPEIGAFIPGMAVALEEKMANDENSEIDGAIITDLKSSMMGPVAGIGDTIWQGLLVPLTLSIAISLALQGNLLGPLAFGIGMTILDFLINHFFFKKGYTLGVNAVDAIMTGGLLNKVIIFLGIVGMFSLGAMIVKFVHIDLAGTINVATGVIDLKGILNQLIPCIFPLGVVMFSYWMQKKGKSITFVLLLLFVIGFAGGAFGILG